MLFPESGGRVPTQAIPVGSAARAVSLRRDRGTGSVTAYLSDRRVEPPLFRIAVGYLDPTFVLAITGHVPIQDDAMVGPPPKGSVYEAALGDRLDHVERPAMALVVTDEEVRRLVLDGNEVAVPLLDHEVGSAAESQGRIDQSGVRRAVSAIDVDLVLGEQHRQVGLTVVLVHEPVVRCHVQPSVIHHHAQVRGREKRRMSKGYYVERSSCHHRLTRDERSVSGMEELHFVRTPRVCHEVVRSHMLG